MGQFHTDNRALASVENRDRVDITVTAFEIPEIDLLLMPEHETPDVDDGFEIEENARPTTQPGDMWNLGKHRILCGDASDESSYPKLLNAKHASLRLAGDAHVSR